MLGTDSRDASFVSDTPRSLVTQQCGTAGSDNHSDMDQT